MYSWNRRGRMDGGVAWGTEGEAGVMNSWPIPSRMPSNLCYKKGHPSHRQAAVLHTNAQAQKHTVHMLGSYPQRAQWSQPEATVHHQADCIVLLTAEGCSTKRFWRCRGVSGMRCFSFSSSSVCFHASPCFCVGIFLPTKTWIRIQLSKCWCSLTKCHKPTCIHRCLNVTQ